MASFRRGSQWRYRKVVTLPSGARVRISGTPAVNTKAASEAAERAHIERVLLDGQAHVGRPAVAGEARTITMRARVSPSELAEYERLVRLGKFDSMSDAIRHAMELLREELGQ